MTLLFSFQVTFGKQALLFKKENLSISFPAMVGIISVTPCGEDAIVEWSIEYFLTLLEQDYTSGCSEDFSFGGEKWYFTYYLNGRNECDSSGHVDLHLVKYSSDRCCYKQKFSLSLKTVNGEKYNETRGRKIFRRFDNFQFLRFIPTSELSSRQSELLPDGVLTFVCVMKNTTPAKSDSKSLYIKHTTS